MTSDENYPHNLHDPDDVEPDHARAAEEEAEHEHLEVEEHPTVFETPVPTTSEEYIDLELARVRPPA
jgi:hypothetical protein